MKRIVLSVFLLVCLTTYGQDVAVAHAEVYEDAGVERFYTFFWANQVDTQLDDKSYFLNDLLLKADIRSAVKEEMVAKGYRLDERNPDLLVNFRVFEKGVILNGDNDVGRSYWAVDEKKSQNASSSTLNLKDGTLIISVLDKRNGKLIWQGFTSGLIHDNSFIRDEGKIREAVNMILDEYAYRANEYTKR